MATARKISLPLDEELIRRARQQDQGAASKSDLEVVEDPLAVFLGLKALDDARAQATVGPDDADRLAVEELRAAHREQGRGPE
jgi:hypothetical protein